MVGELELREREDASSLKRSRVMRDKWAKRKGVEWNHALQTQVSKKANKYFVAKKNKARNEEYLRVDYRSAQQAKGFVMLNIGEVMKTHSTPPDLELFYLKEQREELRRLFYQLRL